VVTGTTFIVGEDDGTENLLFRKFPRYVRSSFWMRAAGGNVCGWEVKKVE